jgi:hypothetical protein
MYYLDCYSDSSDKPVISYYDEDLEKLTKAGAEILRFVPTNDLLLGRTLDEIIRYYVEKTIRFTNDNRETAAQILGVGERTVYRYIQQWKEQPPLSEMPIAPPKFSIPSITEIRISKKTKGTDPKKLMNDKE